MVDPATIQSFTLVQRSREVAFSQLDDELLAIDAARGVGYALNESAGRIWELIATPISLDAICAQLRQEYQVDEQTCRRDVIAVLQALGKAGLVEMKDGARG